MKLIPLMQAQYPRAHLHDVEAMSGVLQEQLLLGRLDLAVLFDGRPWAGLRCSPLLTETLYLLLPANHPLAVPPCVDLENVAALSLVLPTMANSIRKRAETACHARDLRLAVLADVGSLPGLLGLVRAACCAVLPNNLRKVKLTRAKLWQRSLKTRRCAGCCTLHRRAAPTPRASMAIGKLIQTACSIWSSVVIGQPKSSRIRARCDRDQPRASGSHLRNWH